MLSEIQYYLCYALTALHEFFFAYEDDSMAEEDEVSYYQLTHDRYETDHYNEPMVEIDIPSIHPITYKEEITNIEPISTHADVISDFVAKNSALAPPDTIYKTIEPINKQVKPIMEPIRSLTNIQSKESILNLINDYANKEIQQSIRNIKYKLGCDWLIRVRGDGNCFFRAFMFDLCHYTCKNRKIESGHSLYNLFHSLDIKNRLRSKLGIKQINPYYSSYLDFELLIDEIFKSIQRVDMVVNESELITLFQGEEHSNNLVLLSRVLIALEILEKESNYEMFILYQFGIDNNLEFIWTHVLKMGEEAEEIHITSLCSFIKNNKILASYVRDMRIPMLRIVYLDRAEDRGVNFEYDICSEVASLSDKEKIYFNLLYRPGHYDILL
jgi:hypothetical protein